MKSKTKNWIIAVLSALLALLGANEGYEYATGDALLFSKQAPYPSGLEPELADADLVTDDDLYPGYDAPWWQVWSIYEIEATIDPAPGRPEGGTTWVPIIHEYNGGKPVQNYLQPDIAYCEDFVPMWLELYAKQTGKRVRCAHVVSYTADNPNKKKKKK